MNVPIFNHQEQRVLVSLCLVWTLGSAVNLLVQRYPRWQSILNSLEEDRFVRRVNVNTAGYDELVAIPYIGDFTARQLMSHRPFSSLDEVKSVPGIRVHNFERFEKHLTVGDVQTSWFAKGAGR